MRYNRKYIVRNCLDGGERKFFVYLRTLDGLPENHDNTECIGDFGKDKNAALEYANALNEQIRKEREL